MRLYRLKVHKVQYIMIYISPKNLPWKPGRGIDTYIYCFFNYGDRWGGRSEPSSGRFTPGKDPVPNV